MNNAYRANMIEITRYGRLWIDVFQVPLERLAVQVLAQFDSLADVARINRIELGQNAVKILGVLVRPHVDETTVIFVDDLVGAARKRVGRLLAENVAHVTARQYQQGTTAHPNLLRLIIEILIKKLKKKRKEGSY